MRHTIFLVAGLSFVGACSGETPEPRPDPEICDDEIDNDGDGDVDCDDSECGGLPCQLVTDTDEDTGMTGPPPEAEVLFDPATCCDFEFTQMAMCTQGIGEVTFINRSLEEAGDYDISCDQLGGSFPISFQVSSGNNPVPFLTNRPIDPEESVTVQALFVCNISQTFTVDCNAKIEVGSEVDEVPFSITGTLTTP